jgi:hypothetical protein
MGGRPGAMRSEQKLDVIIEPMKFGDKSKMWVRVRHKNGFQFIPSFEDLYRIIQAICECEDSKYPNGQGRAKVQDFLWDSCEKDIGFSYLALKYEIPIRNENEKNMD